MTMPMPSTTPSPRLLPRGWCTPRSGPRFGGPSSAIPSARTERPDGISPGLAGGAGRPGPLHGVLHGGRGGLRGIARHGLAPADRLLRGLARALLHVIGDRAEPLVLGRRRRDQQPGKEPDSRRAERDRQRIALEEAALVLP